jgi:glycosyltransferase involved in cell wall biosynthesis
MSFDIIVVTKNDQARLRVTLKSIEKAHFSGRVIVQDSSTVPNSSQISESLDIDYVHAADSGIYDGMNKAIERVSQSFFLTLNCGDRLLNIPEISDLIEKNDLIFCSVQILMKEGKLSPFSPKVHELSSHMSVCHQGIFIKKSFFTLLGGYNLNYKIAADYDFVTRSLDKNCNYTVLQHEIVQFEGYGGASEKFRWRLETETSLIKRTKSKNPLIKLLIICLHVARFIKFKIG